MDFDPTLVTRLEEAGLNGLPALRTEYYDGWIIRTSEGYSRRANCVMPLYGSSIPLEEKLDYCATEYERAGLPCLFKLTGASQPADLDCRLADRGFVREAETLVATRALEAPVAMPEGVSLFAEPVGEWLQTWEEQSPRTGQSQILKALLGAIPSPSVYVVARQDERLVGCARAVCTGAILGLFDLLVAPEYRRQGIGRKLVEARLSWGFEKGVRRVYLQVMGNNDAARSLQQGFGFAEAYRYWYRGSSGVDPESAANC